MLLVPTYVAPSAIEGLGLFAAAPIAKGTTVWRFDPLLDLVFPEGLLAGYPPGTQAFLRKYGYLQKGTQGYRILDGDNGRFMNHSDRANTDNTGETSFATRDIAAGEEITCNYGEFVEDFVPGRFED